MFQAHTNPTALLAVPGTTDSLAVADNPAAGDSEQDPNAVHLVMQSSDVAEEGVVSSATHLAKDIGVADTDIVLREVRSGEGDTAVGTDPTAACVVEVAAQERIYRTLAYHLSVAAHYIYYS